MVPIFGYGNATESSSSSESLFKELKVNIFQGECLPMRLDDFIQIHVGSTTGKTNIIGAQQNKLKEARDQLTALGGEPIEEKKKQRQNQ